MRNTSHAHVKASDRIADKSSNALRHGFFPLLSSTLVKLFVAADPEIYPNSLVNGMAYSIESDLFAINSTGPTKSSIILRIRVQLCGQYTSHSIDRQKSGRFNSIESL